MANPTLLTSPIAENGDKNVIPATTGATTGLLDQEHGFQQINELPLQAGGLPPQRKDFNGAFNLLSKILFYAQKGYVFEFDENQDYYAGCVVKDTNGGLYCTKADVPASATHPKDDATNWALINYGFNKKETFTSSGSYTAPVTGTYRITLQGGGGGGAGGQTTTYGNRGGGGGGSGANLVFYDVLTKNTAYNFVIGAGGNGGNANGNGSAGGDSTIDIGLNSYVAGGGKGGLNYGNASMGGDGGIGKINDTNQSYGVGGSAGGSTSSTGTATAVGGQGGNSYRGASTGNSNNSARGAGGCGGGHNVTTSTTGTGGKGGNGYITFEYCDL